MINGNFCTSVQQICIFEAQTHIYTYTHIVITSKLSISSDHNFSEKLTKNTKWLIIWNTRSGFSDQLHNVEIRFTTCSLQNFHDSATKCCRTVLPQSLSFGRDFKVVKAAKRRGGWILLEMHIFRKSWILKNSPRIATLSYKAIFLCTDRAFFLLALITEKHNLLFK